MIRKRSKSSSKKGGCVVGYTLFGAIAGFVMGWTLHWYWTRGRDELSFGGLDRSSGAEPFWQETPLVDRSVVEELSMSPAEDLPGEEETPTPVETYEPAPVEPVEEEAEEKEAAEEKEEAEADQGIVAYCARCRTRRPVNAPEYVVTERGRHAVRGTCVECGGKMFSFVERPE